jgi:hypothetical protein
MSLPWKPTSEPPTEQAGFLSGYGRTTLDLILLLVPNGPPQVAGSPEPFQFGSLVRQLGLESLRL